MSTHYEILGVEQTASSEAIKAAYRRIQLQNHPDKTKDLREPERSQREALSKAANVAWEILSDEREKAKYDETLFCPPLPDEPFWEQLAPPPPTPQDQYFNNFPHQSRNHPHASFWAGGIPSHFPNTNYFPFTPHFPTAPPPPQPDILPYRNNGWVLEIKTSPRCRCIELLDNRITEKGNELIIRTKLSNTIQVFPAQDDVTITVTRTHKKAAITEIRSLFRKTDWYGTRETWLYVTIVTDPAPLFPVPREPMPTFVFAWNVLPGECLTKVPAATDTWALLLKFFFRELSPTAAAEQTLECMSYLASDTVLHPIYMVELQGQAALKMIVQGMGVAQRIAAVAYKMG